MNKAKIFLIDQEGKDIKEMLETAYSSEDVLQHLLALKPGLLPGDQINPETPREWLLVKREMGIPDHVHCDRRTEYASFLYGWPPNTMEIYLKQLPLNETESKAFRQELLQFGIFKEAGRWTLRARLDGANRQKAEAIYNVVVGRVRGIIGAVHI